MDIRGKTAVITGGVSGLGEATARLLHSMEANVVLLDVNQDRGLALCEELGQRAAFALTDVTETSQVQAAMKLAMEKFGAIHLAVNCAGVGTPAKVVGKEGPHDLAHFIKVLNINLVGTFDVLRWAAFYMTRNEPDSEGERGVIINTASIAAFEGQIGQVAYAASKAGIVGLTLPAARELARFGIRVVTIAPGTFDTPLLAGLPEQIRTSLGQQIPFPPRLGRPHEFAMLVQHIIQNPVLNGETIRLDGALRMPPK
jgi:NAD(P)-dependent dehydrogenase (short-subunit alcohol dehydrogenase family)